MKLMHLSAIVFLTLILVMACGSDVSDDSVIDTAPAASPVVALEAQGQGASCPTTLTCPSSLPGGYNTFMYAYHYTTQIQCWYRNSTTNAVSSTALAISPTCATCCAPGYCPNQRLNTITYAQTWSCTQ